MSQIYAEPVKIEFKNILDTKYTQELRNWRNQDFVRENMTNHALIEQSEHERYLQYLKNNNNNKVFVALNYGKPLAIITMKIHWDEQYIEPGTYIIEKEYLGKGYGIIMSYMRLEYIFELMPGARMCTTILKKNERNIQLQKKMGCTLEKKCMVRDVQGKEEEAVVYTLTKKDWDNHKISIEQKIDERFGLKNIRRINICD